MAGLTQARLRELISYDAQTGVFTRLVSTSPNAQAGSSSIRTPGQYTRLTVDGVRYRANRLAYLYMTGSWPSVLVDHIDTDRSNDAWGNLRLATDGQNQHNRRSNANNRSGVKGVSWHKRTGTWRADVALNGRQRSLGHFKTLEAAAEAVRVAREQLHGAFANHGGQ